MTENKRIEKIQQEYHEFCLSLLNKVPEENTDKQVLAQRAYHFLEELRMETGRKSLIDYYCPAIIEIKTEINKQSI